MKVAFYAPLKPLDHPVPSGDRQMGRLLRAALEAAGCEVMIASTLRSFLPLPDAVRQAEIGAKADAECARLLSVWSANPAAKPALWFTYHNHYKAPDLLGPTIAKAMGMAYILAEASHAPRRAAQWTTWADASTQASRAADLHLCFTERDRAGLLPLFRCGSEPQMLPPFLDTRCWPARAPRARGGPARLVTVAMMRPGDKLASYRFLAAALSRLLHLDWALRIVGDGLARPEVEAAFAEVPPGRLHWCGALDAAAVRNELAGADLYVWPGFGEAFGMGYLEAQASGLPVAALATAGVPSVVHAGVSAVLVDEPTPEAYAAALGPLISDPERRSRLGEAARRFVHEERSFDGAVGTLRRALSSVRARVPERAD